MEPISKNYFGKKEAVTIVDIYDYLTSHADAFASTAEADILSKKNIVADSELLKRTSTMEDGDVRSEELVNFFTILALTYDITIKKQLIEKLIDSMNQIDEEKTQ